MMMKLLTALLVLLAAATFAGAQQPAAPQDPATATADPIEQLRLTPEQRQAIRQIVAENKDERQIANRRLREANVALDQALDAEPTDENVIEQRINDLSAAQATQLRLRIQTEMKIRRILRPEQIATLRRLRLQVRDVMSPQRLNNPRVPANQGFRPRR
jgi:Spy/CpxP family protein refolding chaperone